MGTPHRPAPEVCLSASGAEPAGGGGAVKLERARCGLKIEDRTRAGDRADFLLGTTGQAAQAVGSGAGCRTGRGWSAGVDRGEVGGTKIKLKHACVGTM